MQNTSGKAFKTANQSHYLKFLTSNSWILNPRYIAQLQLLSHFKKLDSQTSYLEIGSGKGDFFNLLKSSGRSGNFFALEPQEAAQEHLDEYGVQIINANITEPKVLGEKKFDVIILSHALEHFNPHDLKAICKNIYDGLDKGGILLCEVPNADLYSFPNAVENIVPHLSFFTKNALLNSLRIQDSGRFTARRLDFRNPKKPIFRKYHLTSKAKNLIWLRLETRVF